MEIKDEWLSITFKNSRGNEIIDRKKIMSHLESYE